MLLQEALVALSNGETIRLTTSDSDLRLTYKMKDGKVFSINEDGSWTPSNFFDKRMMSNRWEVVEEEKLLSFPEVLKYFLEGKKIRRKEWLDHCFMKKLGQFNDEILIQDADNFASRNSHGYAIFSLDDVNANDWYVIK